MVRVEQKPQDDKPAQKKAAEAPTPNKNLNQYNSNKRNHQKLKVARVLFLYLVDSIHQQLDIKNFYKLLKESQRELIQI